MGAENKIKEVEAVPEAVEAVKSGGLVARNVDRYIRYVVFLVIIGLVYIWNSHVAEQQVRREHKLRAGIEDAKAEFKTMQARLSAGTRQSVVAYNADSLGLSVSSKNIYQLSRD